MLLDKVEIHSVTLPPPAGERVKRSGRIGHGRINGVFLEQVWS